MYWKAKISERLLSKQKTQDLKWINWYLLVLPSFVSCITRITHFDKKTWQNNLVLYKIQIHVQKDPYTSTKFKSMCNMTPLPYHYKIQIHVQNDPSTKFKSRYTHTELSLYKIQIHVKTKPYKTKGQTKKTLHKIQAPSSYKNSFLKTTYFWHFWLTWIWIL